MELPTAHTDRPVSLCSLSAVGISLQWSEMLRMET